MIRYPITETTLLGQLDAAAPTWRSRTAARTKKFLKAKRYDEEAGLWSEIKPVFMSLQHNKCAFCERRLEGPRHGRIEHDLEHFRPKSEVRVWPTDEILRLDPQSDAHLLDALCKDTAPHTNCTRAFRRLMQTDAQEARRQFEFAKDYIESQS